MHGIALELQRVDVQRTAQFCAGSASSDGCQARRNCCKPLRDVPVSAIAREVIGAARQRGRYYAEDFYRMI